MQKQPVIFRTISTLVIAACCVMNASAQSTGSTGATIKTVDVVQGQSMNRQGALLLDVREPHEYTEGHAPGSVLIPLGQLASRLNEIRAFEGKPVVVICRSGRRSEQAAGILAKAGFTAVHNVQGGMLAWEKAALPIARR
jgi:rhodanese-related sulfurtransferase